MHIVYIFIVINIYRVFKNKRTFYHKYDFLMETKIWSQFSFNEKLFLFEFFLFFIRHNFQSVTLRNSLRDTDRLSVSDLCRDYLFYKNRLLYQLPMCVFRSAMQSRRIVRVICKRSTLWLTTSLCWLLVIVILLFWLKFVQWIRFILLTSD